jgi:hypothetical protein
MIVCAHFEDKHYLNGYNLAIGLKKPEGFFLAFDIVTLIILVIYLSDNTAYACTYGLKKKVRIYHLMFETLLIAVIISLHIIEIYDVTMRF